MNRFLHLLDFYIYFKSFYYRRRDEVWLDLDGIPGRQRWRGKEGREKRRTLVNLGRNRECQGRNSLRLVFVTFYRSRRSSRRYLNEGHPSFLSFHYPNFTLVPKNFLQRRFRRTRILSLSLSLLLSFPLSKSKVEIRKKNLWAFRDRIRAIAIPHFLFVRTTTDRCPQGANPMLFLATRYSTRAQREIPTSSPLWLSR